jgi:hypothetical protein
MKINYKLIDSFLDTIFPLPEEFGIVSSISSEYSEYSEGEPIDFDILLSNVHKVDKSTYIEYGASKMVINCPSLNVVIKIPFNGFYTEDEFGDLTWTDFRWAPSKEDLSDYCLAEYEKYDKLRTYGLDCFVAKTIFYKEKDGVKIFLQEKITPKSEIWETSYETSKRSRDLAKRWLIEGKISMDLTWIASCIDNYGELKVKRFLDYCENIDLDILEDMHNGNFGYRKNETPCLLDFSSFKD